MCFFPVYFQLSKDDLQTCSQPAIPGRLRTFSKEQPIATSEQSHPAPTFVRFAHFAHFATTEFLCLSSPSRLPLPYPSPSPPSPLNPPSTFLAFPTRTSLTGMMFKLCVTSNRAWYRPQLTYFPRRQRRMSDWKNSAKCASRVARRPLNGPSSGGVVPVKLLQWLFQNASELYFRHALWAFRQDRHANCGLRRETSRMSLFRVRSLDAAWHSSVSLFDLRFRCRRRELALPLRLQLR